MKNEKKMLNRINSCFKYSIMFVVWCLFVLNSYGQDKSFIIDPYFGELNYGPFMQQKLQEAEFVFEGTVIERSDTKNEKGEYIAKVVYEVHKVFKGDISQKTIVRISNVSKLIDEYNAKCHYYEIPPPINPGWPLPNEGTTGIITANMYGSRLSLKDSLFLEETFDTPYINYSLGYEGKYALRDKHEYILYEKHAGEEFYFKSVSDAYDFVMQSIGTSSYKDLTNKDIRKITREEWIKKKLKYLMRLILQKIFLIQI